MAGKEATTGDSKYDDSKYKADDETNSNHHVDEPDWDPGIDPDDSGPLLRTIGRQLKLWRDAAGYGRAEFGAMVGYSGEMIGSMERGIRNIRPEFLDLADEILNARGHLKAFKEDLEKAKQPRKIRNVAKVESQASELGAYSNHNVNGLLQTEEYARALFAMRRPALTEEDLERYVTARMARQEILSRRPLTTVTFVQEEVTLRRPIGGKAVVRRQLEHLLELGQQRNVEIQVMPTDREDHAGMGGELHILKLKDGSSVGYSEAQLSTRLVTNPKEVQLLELRYGIIRSQALAPRDSLAFINDVLGET